MYDLRSPLSRRAVLRTATLAGLAALFPARAFGADVVARILAAGKILVMLELEGGNDGLNTIVPYADTNYQSARSTIRLRTDSTDDRYRVIPFTDFSGATALPKPAGVGVHAALNDLMPAWQGGNLAIVQGLGYAQSNRSHFRGIDLWNHGVTDADPEQSNGWLGRMFTGQDSTTIVDGIALRRAGNNAATMTGVNVLAMDNASDYLARTSSWTAPTVDQFTAAAANPALLHLLNTRKLAVEARGQLNAAVGTPPAFGVTWSTSDIGRQLRTVAESIAGGMPCPFYKVSTGSFDTHADQPYRHRKLWVDVSLALKNFRDAMIEKSKWNNVLVVTYSEFGRRIAQNNSDGTDHGTAAPHLLLGGSVIGGIHGTQPSLTAVDERNDMIATTDFRRYLATIGQFLGISATNRDAALEPSATTPAGLYTPLAVLA